MGNLYVLKLEPSFTPTRSGAARDRCEGTIPQKWSIPENDGAFIVLPLEKAVNMKEFAT
ncbi:MAG: hypothetical protein WAN03_04145 [Candidatus Sulfotelmatobacter sp.]